MAGNEYTSIIQGEPSEGNEYTGIIQGIEENDKAEVKNAFAQAAQTTPEAAAEVDDLSQTTGLPYNVVEQEKESIQKRVEAEKNDYTDIIRNSPVTAKYYKDHAFAKIAKDDAERLPFWEQISKGVTESGDHYQAGKSINRSGELGHMKMMGNLDDVSALELNQLEKTTQREPKNYGFFYDVISNTSELTGQFVDPAIGALDQGLKFGLASGGALLVAGQLGPQVLAPEEVVTVPAAGFAGLYAGSTAYMAQHSYIVESGHAYLEFENIRDDQGNPIDKAAVKAAAQIVGTINAGLEVTGLSMMAKATGVNKLTSLAMRDQTKKLFQRKGFRQAFTEFAKRYTTAWGGEVTTEVMQEGVNMITGEMLKMTQEDENTSFSKSELTMAQASARLSSIAYKVGTGMLIPAGGGASVNLAIDVKRARLANEQQKLFEALGSESTETRIRELSPKRFQSFVAEATKNGAVENIYVSAEKFKEYFQSKDIAPEDAAAEIGAQESYVEALQTGGDMQIKTSDYATYLAPSEHHAGLMPNLKFNANDMSFQEAQDYQQNYQSELESEAQRIVDLNEEQARIDEPVDAFYNDLRKQLSNSGRRPDAAAAEASLVAAMFRTEAKRSGKPAQELIDQWKVRVQRQFPESITPVDTTDLTIDALRERKFVNPRELFGPSLGQFISEQGGILDEGGELTARDLQLDRIGRRKIVSEEGMTLESAVERARQEGFALPEGIESHDALLNALVNEVSGSPLYAAAFENEQKIQRERQLDELGEYLEQIGLNIQDASNKEVKDAITKGYIEDQIDINGLKAFYQGEQNELEVGQNREITEESEAITETTGDRDGVNQVDDGGTAVEEIGIESFAAGLSEEELSNPSNIEFARLLWDELGTESPFFKKWFGNSMAKIDGDPILVYHGTNKTITDFDVDKPYADAFHAAGALGHFFAKDRLDSEHYGDIVHEGYVKLENPLELNNNTWMEMTHQFETNQDAIDKRNELIEQGHDGIFVKGINHIVVFDGQQFKDKTNRGTFSEQGDIFFQDTETVTAEERQENFETWSEGAEFIEEPGSHEFKGGEPVVVLGFHGTTHDFREIDTELGNPENDLGRGFYVTSDRGDAQQNYLSDGPDLTSRIEQRKEQLVWEIEQDPEAFGLDPEAEHDFTVEAERVARDELTGIHKEGKLLELFVKMKNPAVIDRVNPANSSKLNFMPEYSREALDEYQESAEERVMENYDIEKAELDDYKSEIEDAKHELMDEDHIEPDDWLGEIVQDKINDIMRNENVDDFSRLGEDSRLQEMLMDDFVSMEDFVDEAKKAFAYVEDMEEGGLIGNQMVGELLQELGFDGVIYQDASEHFTNMGLGTDTKHFIVWEPTNVKSVENRGTFSATDRDIFLQDEGKGPRGSIEFGDEALITLYESANMSTFLHESGHLFLEVMKGLATDPNASPEIKADFDAALKYMGVEPGAEIETKHHEIFARSFEAYLFEGKAPSVELQSVFQRFSAWLKEVYKRITALNVELNDEIRGVFDRMLATEEEIANAQNQGRMEPLFKDADEAGVPRETYEKYIADAQKVTDDATRDLERRALNEVRREAKSWWKEQWSNMRDKVSDEFSQRPVYQAILYFTGEQIPTGAKQVKLGKKELIEMYGPEVLKRLRQHGVAKRNMYSDEGIHPNRISDLFGYRSGDEMVLDILNTPKFKKAVEEEATARMKDRHGDMMSDGSMAEEALDALHADERGVFLETELKMLSDRIRRPGFPAKQAQAIAEAVMGRKLIRDASKKGQFHAAEVRAAKAAEKAMLEGNMEEAALQKRNQLLNHYLYREATKVAENIDKGLRYLGKFEKAGTRKNIAQDYMDQIDAMLESFDLRRSVTLKELNRRQNLREWMDSKRTEGEEIILDPNLIERTRQKHYKEMTVDEFNGVIDAVKNIDWVARLKQKLLDQKDKREFNETVEDIIESIEANNKMSPVPLDFAPTKFKQALKWSKEFAAEHVKMEFLFHQLDGNKFTGPVWKALFKPLADAEAAELVWQEKITKELNDVFDLYGTIERDEIFRERKFFLDKIHVPEMDQSFHKGALISMALNWGNDGNKQALMRGYGWNTQQVEAALDNLNAKDWQVVQGIWDTISQLRDPSFALQKELTGLAPEAVDPVEFTNKHGTFKGGYYPLKYDSSVSHQILKLEEKANAADLFESNWMRPMTKKGHLEERAKNVSQPVKLELSVIAEHVNNAVHDITHRKAIMDADRLIQDPRIRKAVEQAAGRELYREMRPWLQAIARDQKDPSSSLEKIVGHFRVGATIVNMGWKVTTAIVQPLGFFNSVELLGEKYAMKGLKKFYGNPMAIKRKTDEVFEKSVMMRNRQKTFDRDVRDSLKRYKKGGLEYKFHQTLLAHIGFFDMTVSMPTWMGAYEKATAEGMMDEEAVAAADQMVRMSQSSGSAKDLAAIQRGGEFKRMLTMFYSYFSVLFNQLRRRGKITIKDKDIPRAITGFLYLVVLPSVLAELITGRGPDDDDEWAKWTAKTIGGYPFSTMVGVRDVASAITTDFGYGITPVAQAIESVVKTPDAFINALPGGDEFSRNDAKNLWIGTGYILHLPARQTWTMIDEILDTSEGYEFSLFEFLMSKDYKENRK